MLGGGFGPAPGIQLPPGARVPIPRPAIGAPPGGPPGLFGPKMQAPQAGAGGSPLDAALGLGPQAQFRGPGGPAAPPVPQAAATIGLPAMGMRPGGPAGPMPGSPTAGLQRRPRGPLEAALFGG